MSKKIIIVLLIIFTGIALSLHLFKFDQAPVCLNSDEAAFGYNAYSILKTGRDEYGTFLPLRLKSFGDYKLPFFSYASIPFIGLFGLSEFSIRLLPNILGILFPILIYFLSKELFRNEKIALSTAFLTSISPWLQITSRQAHEVTLATFLLSLTLLFAIKFERSLQQKYFILFAICNGLSLFTYHISRAFVIFFFFYLIYICLKNFKVLEKKVVIFVIIFLLPIFLFIFSDKTARLDNLVFYSTSGFTSHIEELRGESNNRILHNKITESIVELTQNYSSYFSPQFLSITGDENIRFGYKGISLITIVEYIFLYIGIYYLFKKKIIKKWLLLFVLLVAPISASLSWQGQSLTRSFFMIIPLLLIIGFGLVHFYEDNKKTFTRKLIYIVSLLFFIFYLTYSWDFYYNHYPKKATVIRASECGYKEIVSYVQQNYSRFKEFNVTDRNGEPYIFFLFYTKYDPSTYQKQSHLSPPDQYGFGQIYGFDKFNFRFNFDNPQKKVSYIGFPDGFQNKSISENKIKKIKIGTEDMFWIYED